MRHVLRHCVRLTLNILLLLALIGWIRSYWRADAIHWSDSRRFLTLMSSAGRLNLTDTTWPHGTAWRAGWSASSISRSTVLPLWESDPGIYGRRRFLGFEWSDDLSPWPSNQTSFDSFFLPSYRLIAVPYWAIAALLALRLVGPLVGPLVGAARRRARLRRGCCPQCAYDLRGTPAGCPECGWSPTQAPLTAQVAGSR